MRKHFQTVPHNSEVRLQVLKKLYNAARFKADSIVEILPVANDTGLSERGVTVVIDDLARVGMVQECDNLSVRLTSKAIRFLQAAS